MGRDIFSFVAMVCLVGLFIVGIIMGVHLVSQKSKTKPPPSKPLISERITTIATPTVSTPAVATPTVSQPTSTIPQVSLPTIATPTVSLPSPILPAVTTPTTQKIPAPQKPTFPQKPQLVTAHKIPQLKTTPKKQYCLQVFATKDKDKANNFLGFLRGRNLDAQITTKDDWYLVRLCGDNLNSLKACAEKLIQEGHIKNFFVILPEKMPTKEEKISKEQQIAIAQVFSSNNLQAAVNLQKTLQLLGYSTKVQTVNIANTNWYRVYITGEYSWLQNELDKLKRQGYIQDYRLGRKISSNN